LSISQRRKIANIKNDMYPMGIYAKARSKGSKKGLGCEYTCESNPACKKKSKPIIENHDNRVSFI
jgi:hypothetical protein